MKFITRFFTTPQDSFFIFGPRGTGKSSWIKNSVTDAYVVNLLEDEVYRQHLADPNYISKIVAANPNIKRYVIDEIQKVPAILDSIHNLIELHKDIQFIITGSSTRKLKRQGVNLLSGRALLTHFHPFMAAELGDKFNLEFALCNGMLPLVFNSTEPQRKIATYISLYLKEEIQTEGYTRNIGDFARFLTAISFSHGSVLNINNIARECQVSRRIVDSYLSILEDLLLGFKLPVFTHRAKRENVVHSKFYLFDAGVYYHLRPKGLLDSSSEISGAGLEGLVFQHVRSWCEHTNNCNAVAGNLQCYYWRTQAGSEVDFVIYGAQHFYAIEVKNHTQVHSTDLRSLKTFGSDYPEARLLLLYRGKTKIKIDNVTCWPVEDFLLELMPNIWPG